jgi:hypothetical protein
MLWWCATIGCLTADPASTAGPGDASPADRPDAPAKIADYGPAFAQLVQLGFPDTTGGKYVKLTLHGEAGRKDAERMMYERQSGGGLPVTGNAWLLPGGSARASECIHHRFERITIAKTAKRSGLLRVLIGPAKGPDTAPAGAVPGDWTEADVAADAKQLIKVLETQSAEGQMLDLERWSYDEDGPVWCAKILGAACHMYRAGHRDEANHITGLLFKLAPEPILVVDYLINDLADRDYDRIVTAFFERRDWQAYHDGTRELVDRFTRGWKSREGAEVLLARLDKQLKGAKPFLATLLGASLKPEAVGIMDDWLTMTEPIPLATKTCWLLGEDMLRFADEEGYHGGPPSGDNGDPARIAELRAMGMDGFIALTAAVTDDTLIPTRLERGYGGYYGGGFGRTIYGSSGGESAGLAQYAAMKRPFSRGELAQTILLDTLPDPENDLSSALPEELQATAHQWWLKHRNDSPSELARHFLESGSSQQVQIAVLALASSDDDENALAVEKYILAAEDITDHFHLVDQYLRIRRGKAREFFQIYAKTLRDLAGDAGDEDDPFGNWQVRQAGGVDKYLKKLSVYVNDVSPEKLLADMRNGELDHEEGFPMLQAANGRKSIVSHLPALVAIARQQDAPDEQLKVLRAIQHLVYNDDPALDTGQDYEALQTAFGEQLALSRDEWTWFLAQEHTGDGPLYGSAPSFAGAAAWMLELIYFNQHSEIMAQLSQIMEPDEFWTFCLDRAERLLAEGPGAEFPAMADEDRQEAIRKTIAPMPSGKILAHYEGLTLSEKLAWDEILDGYEGEPPAGVAGLRKHVVKIIWPSLKAGDASLKKDLHALTYSRVLDRSVVEGVMDAMLKNADRYQDFVIYFQSNGEGSSGINLSVVAEREMDSWKDRILDGGFPLLRDGKARKIAGIFTTDAEGNDLIGHRHDPARKDNAYPLEPPVARIKTMVGDAERFYTILAVETAANLKKRDAEQEDEEDELAIPMF